jgi:hypothetical protein
LKLRVLMACGAGFLGSSCDESRKAKACTSRRDENRILRTEPCLVISEQPRHRLSRIAEGTGGTGARHRFLRTRGIRPAVVPRHSRSSVDRGGDLSGGLRRFAALAGPSVATFWQGPSCVGVFDAALDQAEEIAKLVAKPHARRCPPDRRGDPGPRVLALHTCERRAREVDALMQGYDAEDAEGRGRSMIFNVVPLRRRLDMPRALSGYLRFLRHACANQALVHGTRPPQCQPSDTSRCRTPSGVRRGVPTDEPHDVCYFLCKTPAKGGEPAQGMLVSAAKSNIKVGIQTYSRWSRGKSLTLEELL